MDLKKPVAILAAALCCPLIALSNNNCMTSDAMGFPGGWNPWGNDPFPFQEQPAAVVLGDLNSDGSVDVFDTILARKASIDVFQGVAFSDQNVFKAADVNEDGQYNVADLVQICEFVQGKRTSFTKSSGGNNDEPNNDDPTGGYMDKVRSTLTADVPADVTSKQGNVDYGRVESKTYYSDFAGKTKSVNVLLPAGYDGTKQYPVLYILHGIFGNENSMLDQSMAVQAIAGNLAAKGEAEQMIIVFPSMFTSKTKNGCDGFSPDNMEAYDNFLYDIADSLMPFIESNYSVKKGRENTAITGFSMGGREALYIGLMRSDLFGYIGSACAAPGIVATVDNFATHVGCLQESEVKFKDGNPLPELFLISAARFDGTVGEYPLSYHNMLTANGVEHLWQVIENGDHGGNTVRPHLYNFLKNIFKN